MFNKKNAVDKSFTINADQLYTFSTVLDSWMTDRLSTRRFKFGLTRLGTPSGKDIIYVEFFKVREEDIDKLLSKLNKYGVETA